MKQLNLNSMDGTPIRGYRWEPVGEAKADILLCHGLAEHMGRYLYVANSLAKANYRVTGIELRGHGHSGGKRGHVNRWQDYVEDLKSGARTIEGDHFVLAHSMGGLVGLDHLRSATNVRGFITTGPLLGVAVATPKWKVIAGRLLSRLLPSLSMVNELDPSTVCSDPDVVRAYAEDPLVFNTVTPRWFTELTAALDRVHGHAPHYQIPSLLMWGERDVIVGIDEIHDFAARFGGKLDTRGWQGLFHEILNEPVKDEVLGVILEWLDAHA
ncbi:MAG: alpha/beta hydrolase [Proteobacteria bacterium]|jgi:acylglycerol lipase|nr:alpha/beta hydrolase [Pseudomonadota bacterium]